VIESRANEPPREAHGTQERSVFLVERFAAAWSIAELTQLAERATNASERVRHDGLSVRYLGSTLVPQDQTCFCLFEAESADNVRRLNELAGLGFERILPALAVTRASAQGIANPDRR